MINIPSNREPTHAGEILAEEFLIPLGLEINEVANALHVSQQYLKSLIKGRSKITPSLALRLAKFLGTTPDLWLNLQLRCDLYQAQQTDEEELKSIHPYIYNTNISNNLS
jgi:addiction module HigA family antidote